MDGGVSAQETLGNQKRRPHGFLMPLESGLGCRGSLGSPQSEEADREKGKTYQQQAVLFSDEIRESRDEHSCDKLSKNAGLDNASRRS